MNFSALAKGVFGSSPTLIVSGLQYHLVGEKDTEDLAKLASISSEDHVLDVCCFLAGPALQLAQSFGCKVTGIDISENCIAAAKKLATLCRLDNLVNFYTADAGNLGKNPNKNSPEWSLEDIKDIIENIGFLTQYIEDITERDIEIGWKALIKKLKRHEDDFVETLGKGWVEKAYQKFEKEIEDMEKGVWGNGRIVAIKTRK